MRLKKAIENQYIYSVFTKLLVVSIGFANSVIIARYFGPNIKGITATVLNYSNIFAILLTFGLHEAYPYFLKKSKDKENFKSIYMTNIMFLYLMYSLICLIIILLNHHNTIVIMCAITSFFHGYSMIANYVALVENPNKRNTIVLLINLFDLLILIYFYLFIPVNTVIACIFSMSLFVLESFIFTIFVKPKFSWKQIQFSYLFKLFKFGFFPMIALLLTTLNYRIDIIMLKSMSISYSLIGIYSIGVSLAEKVFLIPTAVKEVLLSKLSKGKDANEVIKVIKVCYPICLIISFFILLFGKIFINIFYGLDFSSSYEITVISVFGTVFMIFFKMISTYYIINGKQVLTVKMLSVSVIINIILNYVLIPKYKIIGAAMASDVSYFICAILFIYSFKKDQNIKFKDLLFLNKKEINNILNRFKKNNFLLKEEKKNEK